ncbi:ATP-binding cassette domain-containing protein [Dactylosporangium matsuzakiense]|uniref:ABC transporter ATP-binding protein n=1 Tax=Dactylosporangium matsuzakiense TaxID=53360 RepID=A0A9W6NM89_9ACTN|nr:ATP-binding cassette domain-containing protein [Dactylosporangium matsuzakiense]UWZ43143.1 ATP-binding cassette domain-containing protein [Dactylosporangium matsuzakiense]GLL02770.1 ABC transporter ATP-binding protein [Dactylosporangium matsuzakiense]
MDAVISSTGLAKTYGGVRRVDGLDLAVPAGVVSGFVGPNGAGKTTTLRMLLGLIRPTEGRAWVLGTEITKPHVYLSQVGAMIEGPAMTPALSGRANLDLLAVLGGHDRSRIGETLQLVGLAHRADDPFRSYSLGMKQRLGIAAALLPDPKLLLLDEPTNGLDPAGIVEIRQLLRRLAGIGITVFVSSHLLSELEAVCDHLVMIRAGRLVFQGPTSELLARQLPRIRAVPEDSADLPVLARLATDRGNPATITDGAVVVDAPATFAGELNREAMQHGITLVELAARQNNLEDAFFALTGSTTGDTGITTLEAAR